jgi:hypothetical protein
LPSWLLEGLFIVASVLLGFAVAQFGEYRNNRELATRALASLQAEIEHNRAALQPLVPIHRAWVRALNKADVSDARKSGLDLFFELRPKLPSGARGPFAFLRRSAWDAAVSGGALRLIDYGVATDLSEIYRVQEIATENVERLAKGPLSSAATFDPASRAPTVRLLWMTLLDIESAEEILLDLYTKHLPTIRAAAADR